jgi:flagellar protein FlaG
MLRPITDSNSPLTKHVVKQNDTPARDLDMQLNQLENKHQQIQSKDEIEKIVTSINEFIKPANTHLKFEFHEDLQEYYVTVVNEITNEVVKEIPSKKLLDMYAQMTEYLGLLVDKKI